jgi:hypothetical protein
MILETMAGFEVAPVIPGGVLSVLYNSRAIL